MEKMTRAISLVLILALLVVLAACGGGAPKEAAAPTQAPETAKPAPTEAAAPTEAPEPEPVTVSYPLTDEVVELSVFFMSNPMVVTALEDTANSAAFRVSEAATGVHLVSRGVMPWTSAEEFSIMLAGGEYTDLVGQFGSLYTPGYDHAIDEGIIYDLSDVVETCAPDFLAALGQYEDAAKVCTTAGGHFPEISSVSKVPNRVESGLWIRADWLEGLGLEVPDTYDELEAALTGFKDEYGAKGMFMMGTGVFLGNWLASGFGINAYQVVGFLSEYAYYQVDGEVRHGWAQPEFKDYLTMMADWYQKGLINPDTLTLQADWMNPDNQKYINSGEVGLWYSSQSGATALESTNVDPNCKVTALPNITKTEGETTHFSSPNANYGLGAGCVVTTACEDLEMAVKWLNWWFTADGFLAANYGEAGTTYNMQNGSPVYTDVIIKHEMGAFMAWNLNCNSVTGIYNDASKLDVVYSETELEAPEVWMSNSDSACVFPTFASLTAEEGDEFNGLMSEINTYASENVLKFIIGEKPMAEFDAFVAQMNEMGLPRCTELKQAAYDRYLALLA